MDDIRSQMQVFGEVAPPTETASESQAEKVTEANPTETKAQVDENTEKSDKAQVEDIPKSERIAEGKKIERKLGEWKARAHRAESELEAVRQQKAEFEKASKEIDLDSLTYDERIEHITDKKMTESALKNRESQLQGEVQDSINEAWEEKVRSVNGKYPDYNEVLRSTKSVLSNDVVDDILNSEFGPDIAYKLAKNPDLAKMLSPNANPITASKVLLKLELEFSGSGSIAQANQDVIKQDKPQIKATPMVTSQGRPMALLPTEISIADFMAKSSSRFL